MNIWFTSIFMLQAFLTHLGFLWTQTYSIMSAYVWTQFKQNYIKNVTLWSAHYIYGCIVSSCGGRECVLGRQPQLGACQDAPCLLICHSDQRLFVDWHQLIPHLQPAILKQSESGENAKNEQHANEGVAQQLHNRHTKAVQLCATAKWQIRHTRAADFQIIVVYSHDSNMWSVSRDVMEVFKQYYT